MYDKQFVRIGGTSGRCFVCMYSCQQDRKAAILLLVTMHNDREICLDKRRFKKLAKVEVGMDLM